MRNFITARIRDMEEGGNLNLLTAATYVYT